MVTEVVTEVVTEEVTGEAVTGEADITRAVDATLAGIDLILSLKHSQEIG